MGPGGREDRTLRAIDAIVASDTIVGYSHYLRHITDLTEGKELVSSGMRQETERCRTALELATAGHTVSLVCSGDSGIYGMAGLVLELADKEHFPCAIEIVPGVSAALAAAARLGAPLMLDCAFISLSDLLVPWESIRTRLIAVAGADMVTVLFNPKSSKRVEQIEETARIFRANRSPDTPVGIATAMGTDDERVVISTLGNFLACEIDMKSIVLIGNSTTRMIGDRMVTPRGYKL